MKKRLYILCNLLVVGAVLLSGCSSEVMLSEADKEILDTATEEYSTLRDTMSPDEAREELVAKLTTEYEGVESAVLGDDGYTIFMEFSDDDFAAIYTLEPSELPPPPSESSYSFEHEETSRGPDQFVDMIKQKFLHQGESASEDEEEKITPQSNKVLILNPLESGEIYVEEGIFTDYFKEHGWKDDDIDIKSPGENVTLEDYFGLGEYGIILFFGHGGYSKGFENNINYFYIQGCPANDTLFQNNRQYGEWKKEEKLIIVRHLYYDVNNPYCVGIRLDLLQEMMDVLPSSYVHFSTCYGLRAASAFYGKGAKIFLSWDNKVNADIADENQLNMLKLMAGENYCASDAYLDDTIVPSWETNDGTLTRFLIYPDPSSEPTANTFYLPAWVNLTVTGIPEGTSFIRAGVYDKDSKLLTQDDEAVGFGVTQVEMKEVGGLMLAPTEEARVEARAFNITNQELGSGQSTTTLNAGGNALELSLTQEEYTWYFSGDEYKVSIVDNSPAGFFDEYLNDVVVPFEVLAECLPFKAKPGDRLRITYMVWWFTGACHYFGPIWLHRADDVGNKKVQLSDGEDSGCYSGPDLNEPEIVFDQTYTIPNL